MPRLQAGLTLIEILFSLAILLALVNLGIPGMRRAVDRAAADSVMKQVVAAIALARETAIIENTLVTLCPSDDGQQCRGQWQQGSILFTDRNGDRELNGNDRLLRRMPPVAAKGELRFRSFGNRQYLQMTPRGHTNHQNGNFTFCPRDGDPVSARQAVINMAGRVRLSRDSDGDGIVENSRGEPVSCE